MFSTASASLTIEMPNQGSFCELDAIELCKEDECVRHDPYVQKNAPSIFTASSQGRVNDWSLYELNLTVNFVIKQKKFKLVYYQLIQFVLKMRLIIIFAYSLLTYPF